MTDIITPPLAVHFVWHHADNESFKKYCQPFRKFLTRDIERPFSRELNIPIVALCQVSRDAEGSEPTLAQLRGSGSIEQDADVVMFLYRDEYYNADSEKKGTAEIIIAKQRNGPIGSVDLAWLSQYTKFANIERSKGQYE